MQLTIRDLRDLAQGDASCCGLDLRLAIGQSTHDRGSHNLRANDLAIAALGSSSSARHDQNLHGRALCGPVAVVQVVKVAALALIEDSRAAEGQRAVATGREAGGVNGAGLSGLVILELEVASNIARTTLRIEECAIGESGDEDAVRRAGFALLEECQLK